MHLAHRVSRVRAPEGARREYWSCDDIAGLVLLFSCVVHNLTANLFSRFGYFAHPTDRRYLFLAPWLHPLVTFLVTFWLLSDAQRGLNLCFLFSISWPIIHITLVCSLYISVSCHFPDRINIDITINQRRYKRHSSILTNRPLQLLCRSGGFFIFWKIFYCILISSPTVIWLSAWSASLAAIIFHCTIKHWQSEIWIIIPVASVW